MNKVLITGGGGYIGTRLIKDLLDNKYTVKCLDRFYFGIDIISPFIKNDNFLYVRKDIRSINTQDFADIDFVIDLAGISNDPACDLDPAITDSINHQGALHCAKTAKESGVKRYIMASSCSIYGTGSDNELNENSQINPVSHYAKSKIDAERDIAQLSSQTFCVTFLRLATVYGLSLRMRFDLIVNIMTMHAYKSNSIIVLGGGKQWRPLIHIKDVATAFIKTLEALTNKINGEAFNVGSNDQNYQVIRVANIIKSRLKNVNVIIAPDDPDKRSYHVSFDKINNILGFKTEYNLELGIDQIHNALLNGEIDSNDITTVTVEFYKYLINADKILRETKIDGSLF